MTDTTSKIFHLNEDLYQQYLAVLFLSYGAVWSSEEWHDEHELEDDHLAWEREQEAELCYREGIAAALADSDDVQLGMFSDDR